MPTAEARKPPQNPNRYSTSPLYPCHRDAPPEALQPASLLWMMISDRVAANRH